MEVFVARHPIFDRLNKVYGYDLAFREGFEAFYDTVAAAKAEVDLQIALNFDELAGHGRAHIIFPRELLLKELPILFPAKTLTIGLPGDAGDDPAVVSACERLKGYGYELAMDEFRAAQLDSPLLKLADVVRVDTDAVPQEEQKQLRAELAKHEVRRLAKNVHTAEAFHRAEAAGYWYFQGDYFRKPLLRPGKEVPTSKLHYLRVLTEVNKPELEYDELDAMIKQDVAMAYKLLRFINSAWYGLRSEVKSIRHALVLLGPAEVRMWASLLVLRDVGRDKPNELFRRSLTRAKVAEGLAPLVDLKDEASELFLMGMFSLVDALTDVPMARVMEGLPLSENVREALLHRAGKFGTIYQAILAYELGQWEELSDSAAAIPLDEDVMPELFRKSLRWANEALSVIEGQGE